MIQILKSLIRILVIPLAIILLAPAWVIPIHEATHAIVCTATDGEAKIEFQRGILIFSVGRTFCTGGNEILTGLGPTLLLSLPGLIYLVFWNLFRQSNGIVPFALLTLVGAQGASTLFGQDTRQLSELGLPMSLLMATAITLLGSFFITMYRYFSEDYVRARIKK